MSSVHVVRGRNLRVGDTLATADYDGTYVTELYQDLEGIWVAWSDGDEGYVSAETKFLIYFEGD